MINVYEFITTSLNPITTKVQLTFLASNDTVTMSKSRG